MVKAKDLTKFNIDKFLQQKMKEERQEQIYEMVKLRSKVRKVNRALAALRKAGMYDESIAVENIFTYLEQNVIDIKKTKVGNISLVGLDKKSMTQLFGIEKQIEKFIRNKTSSVQGMLDLYDTRREELRKMINNEEFVNALSNKDIKTIYSVFQSNEYKKLQSRMGSPEFFVLYTQAIDEGWTKDKFQKEMNNYLESGEDLDLKDSLSDIYDNFISNYVGK